MIDNRDINGLVQLNIDEAKRLEETINAQRAVTYQNMFNGWVRNEPIRTALRLDENPEPEPPLRFHATFDIQNFLLVAMEGPDRLDRALPPAPPPPAPPVESLPGEAWPGRTDIRLLRLGDKVSVGTMATVGGEKWVVMGNPFGGRYWMKQ